VSEPSSLQNIFKHISLRQEKHKTSNISSAAFFLAFKNWTLSKHMVSHFKRNARRGKMTACFVIHRGFHDSPARLKRPVDFV